MAATRSADSRTEAKGKAISLIHELTKPLMHARTSRKQRLIFLFAIAHIANSLILLEITQHRRRLVGEATTLVRKAARFAKLVRKCGP